MSSADAVVLHGKPSASPSAGAATASASHVSIQDFNLLVREHRPRIVRFLTGMIGDRDAAEDLTQECFLRAHQAAETFRGEAAFSTWLVRIAINLATDYQRNRRFQFWRMLVRPREERDLHDLSETVADGVPGAERRLIARQQVERVAKATRRLPAQQRSVFLLRFVEELEISEIAEATGLAEGTVKIHLFRAVRAVRKAVREG
jgi:RNA polymerase sigma-70 factor (ECF subfamily)